jgi:hypothetical protein
MTLAPARRRGWQVRSPVRPGSCCGYPTLATAGFAAFLKSDLTPPDHGYWEFAALRLVTNDGKCCIAESDAMANVPTKPPGRQDYPPRPPAGISGVGQGTKSLRESPLRGGLSARAKRAASAGKRTATIISPGLPSTAPPTQRGGPK